MRTVYRGDEKLEDEDEGRGRARLMRSQKTPDSRQNTLINFFLSFARRFQLSSSDQQRVVPAFNDVHTVCRFHLCSYAFQQMQRTERIACALYEEDRRGKRQKHL